MERYQDDRLVYDHYKFKLDDLKNCKDTSKISRVNNHLLLNRMKGNLKKLKAPIRMCV